jgi:glucose-1-phosphate thymidylyltransferase
MKGIILAGGTGSRLMPLTKVTNKHLLPVYNEPMIYYPLKSIVASGIKDIMIVSGRGHAGHFLNLLGSGKEFGVRISYEVQEEAGGIAEALGLARSFADEDKIAVILGDNIYEDNSQIAKAVKEFDQQKFNADGKTVGGAKILLKEVPDPERFGVAELRDGKVISIEEKPKQPKSNYCVTGFYCYDNQVFEIIKNLKPSHRGELEITDVNNLYVKQGSMTYKMIKGEWTDAGTFDSLLKASNLAAKINLARNKGI